MLKLVSNINDLLVVIAKIVGIVVFDSPSIRILCLDFAKSTASCSVLRASHSRIRGVGRECHCQYFIVVLCQHFNLSSYL